MNAAENRNLSPNQRMFVAGLLKRFELFVLTEDEQEMVNILLKVNLDIRQARGYTQKVLSDPRKYGYCEGGCLKDG